MILDQGCAERTGRHPGHRRTGSRAAARYWEVRWHDDRGEHTLRFSLRDVADSYRTALRQEGLLPTLDRHTEADPEREGPR
jgi:hypothetical protein